MTIKVYISTYDCSVLDALFDAMDVSVQSSRRLGVVKRQFEGYPQLVITEFEPFSDGRRNLYTRNNFEVNSLEEYKELVQKLQEALGTTMYLDSWGKPQPILSISDKNYWLDTDGHYYYAIADWSVISEGWKNEVDSFDYWWMMADRPNKCGDQNEKDMFEFANNSTLADKAYLFWFGQRSFGLEQPCSKEEAYKLFNIYPQVAPKVEDKVFTGAYNTPCLGFPPHDKRIGWMEGDWNIESTYSNARQWSKAEYEKDLRDKVLFKEFIKYLKDIILKGVYADEHPIPKIYYDICKEKALSIRSALKWEWDVEMSEDLQYVLIKAD